MKNEKIPPIIINSFPKSGTHLLAQMMAVIAEPNAEIAATRQQRQARKYLSTHENGGWGPRLRSLHDVMEALTVLQPGQYAGAHLAASPDIMQWAENENISVIFLYRDLRDIVVSETYHIEGTNPTTTHHPYKTRFNNLPNHESRMRAVLTGMDGWPSIRERWEQYAGWLTTSSVLPVRFRDLRYRPKLTCAAILGYIYERTGRLLPSKYIEWMMGSVAPPLSPTYRTSRAGDWKTEFTSSLKLEAEEQIGNWVEALGFNEEIIIEPGGENWIYGGAH